MLRRAGLLLALLSLAVILLGVSCRATILPPHAPGDPVDVFVLDHGRHTSLVLPREGGGLVRYSYGDWKFYALRQDGPREGTSAVLWPTEAALGRREMTAQPREADLRRELRVGVQELLSLRLERAAVRELRDELEALFAARLDGRVLNLEYDLEFVPHPRRYHLFHNSNHMVAHWLRRLGCEVRGPTVLAAWRIRG
jgi:hypothetical protein